MFKDKTYYSLSKKDRFLALGGVPVNYLKHPVDALALNFMQTSIQYNTSNMTVVDPEYQSKFLLEVLKNISCVGESALYAVGSYPTEQSAYQLATLICKVYADYAFEQKLYPSLKWIDLGYPPWEYLKSTETNSLVVIHGLSESCSENKKIEITRDFLRRTERATRILITTTPNILSYAILKIGVTPDAVFQLTKTINRVIA